MQNQEEQNKPEGLCLVKGENPATKGARTLPVLFIYFI